jgi:hypothetical protein
LGFPALLFARSADGGRTFDVFADPLSGAESRVKHICGAEQYDIDRVSLAADPDGALNSVHAFFNSSHYCIAASHSSDRGDNWTAAVQVGWPIDPGGPDPPDPEWHVYSPRGAVDDQGVLHLVWTASQYPDLDGCAWIRMRSRAPDGTWTPDPLSHPPEDPLRVAGPRELGYRGGDGTFGEYCAASIAVDYTPHVMTPFGPPGPRHGWLYVVYASGGPDPSDPDPGTRVQFVRSCDQGQNWSEPFPVSPDDAHPASMQAYPMVGVDGRGNIGVTWLDTRFNQTDPAAWQQYDAYLAYSADGGDSWHEERLSRAYEPGPPTFRPQ